MARLCLKLPVSRRTPLLRAAMVAPALRPTVLLPWLNAPVPAFGWEVATTVA